jgi:hypothetical protein
MTIASTLATILTGTIIMAATPVAAPVAAHADALSRPDARRDVLFVPVDSSATPAPRHERADITQITAEYANGRISTRIRLRDLQRGGVNNTVVGVKTPQFKVPYVVIFIKQPGADFLVISPPLAAGQGRVRCPRLRAAFRPRSDVVRVSLPSRCIGEPRWVRVGAQQGWSSVGELDVYADDALRDGDVRAFPALGPRLFNS